MAYDWLTHEILGDIDDIAPRLRFVPPVPVLDTAPALRDFAKSAGAADATVAEIEFRELTDKLCPIDAGIRNAQLDRDVARFSKPEPESDDNFIKGILSLGKRRIDRRAQINKGAPRRRRELREMAEDCLGGLLPRSDAEFVKDSNFWLDSFAESAERLTREILLEAAL